MPLLPQSPQDMIVHTGQQSITLQQMRETQNTYNLIWTVVPNAGRAYLAGLFTAENQRALLVLILICFLKWNYIQQDLWEDWDVKGIIFDGCHRDEAVKCENVWVCIKPGGIDMEVFGNGFVTRKPTQVRAQHISLPFKTLPDRVNSCRLELEINYSASTSSLSLWIGFSVLSLPAHFS